MPDHLAESGPLPPVWLDWRQQFSRSFSQMLTEEPFVQKLEVEAVRMGPSHTDWWVRAAADDDESDDHAADNSS